MKFQSSKYSTSFKPQSRTLNQNHRGIDNKGQWFGGPTQKSRTRSAWDQQKFKNFGPDQDQKFFESRTNWDRSDKIFLIFKKDSYIWLIYCTNFHVRSMRQCGHKNRRGIRRTSFEIHDVVNMSLREKTLREQLYSWSNMVVRRARCSKF